MTVTLPPTTPGGVTDLPSACRIDRPRQLPGSLLTSRPRTVAGSRCAAAYRIGAFWEPGSGDDIPPVAGSIVRSNCLTVAGSADAGAGPQGFAPAFAWRLIPRQAGGTADDEGPVPSLSHVVKLQTPMEVLAARTVARVRSTGHQRCEFCSEKKRWT